MVTKVIIRDNKKSPIRYISKLNNFKNGKEYEFKTGVNIIVGENGCGKTTLLKLIKKYMLVDYTECSKGLYNSNINSLFNGLNQEDICDGIDVYSDYTKNVFRLSHPDEKSGEEAMESFNSFKTLFVQKHSSTGEGVLAAINSLFRYMLSSEAKLTFDYKQFEETYPSYYDYVKNHKIDCDDEYTILMDEPDRNLSLENILQIKDILSFHKPQTQIIAVVHNPILIYTLSKIKDINFIEMSKGYINKINKQIENLIK